MQYALHGYVENLAGFGLKPSAGDISGSMQYAPTRMHPKPGGFHISTHVPTKNAPDFILLNKDACKTRPVLHPNRRRRTFRGVCFYAPTRVRAKFGGFHISAHEYAKNAPNFTLPNRNAPKTHLILDPNRRRGLFGGVCFCALHGYVKNLAGFIFPHTDTPKNAPDFTLPNRNTPKTRPILDPNLRRGYLRGVCFCALHGYVKNLADFRPKPLTRNISGRIQYAPTRVREKPGGFHIPAHRYTQNAPDFRPKPLTRNISGRMLLRPTRVHEKFGGFHISAHDMTRNPAGFGR